MKSISYEQVVAMCKLNAKIKAEELEKIYMRECIENIKRSIENNAHLTVKEKIMLEMCFGIWNGMVYTEDEICKLYELTKEEWEKIWGKVLRKTDCLGGRSGELKPFLSYN